MNKKLILVIALIGIGLYALPATMSLFAGQHSFVNIDATGNQIDCVKCHGDVKAELDSSGTSAVTGTKAPHTGFKCEYCHRIEAGSASGDNAYEVVGYSVGTTTATKATVYIATDVLNMEAFNIPATIMADSNAIQIKAMATRSGILFTSKGTMTVSPCYINKVVSTTGNCAPGTVLTVGADNGIKLNPTYNPVTGTPLDTTASKNLGLDLGKVTSWSFPASARSAVPVMDGAGSRTVNPGTAYHAASLVSCMECHGGDEPMGHYTRIADGTDASTGTVGVVACANCHYSSTSHVNQIYTLWAGGFGLTGGQDTGTTEAHKELTLKDDGITRSKVVNGIPVSNGACVSCHTHVAVDIKYTKPTTYQFNADLTQEPMPVDGFVVGGSTITYSGNQPPRSVP